MVGRCRCRSSKWAGVDLALWINLLLYCVLCRESRLCVLEFRFVVVWAAGGVEWSRVAGGRVAYNAVDLVMQRGNRIVRRVDLQTLPNCFGLSAYSSG